MKDSTHEKQVKGSIVAIEDLSATDIERMFTLLNTYFDGYTYKRFILDLEEKDKAVLLRDRDETIQGFTTFKFIQTNIDRQKFRGVFSGDTVVHEKYQQQMEVPKVWGDFMLNRALEENTPMFWFLICSGYKTYRFLSAFFKQYYPRYDADTPELEQRVLHSFALQLFGSQYDPSTGLIRFAHSQERLKPHVAPITERRMLNPNISYFNARNPQHGEGVELACIVEISPDNYNDFIKRVIGYHDHESSRNQ